MVRSQSKFHDPLLTNADSVKERVSSTRLLRAALKKFVFRRLASSIAIESIVKFKEKLTLRMIQIWLEYFSMPPEFRPIWP
jgi:hypothetical protein